MKNEIKHSVDFINKKAGNGTGFSVPTNYFKELELDIEAKITAETFKKETAFNVPDSYFENIENSILENISLDENTTKVITLKERILKTIPYASVASIALFIGLNTFVFNTTETLTFETISDTEIEYWLNENTISTAEIATLLEDEISNENAFSFANIEDDSIEDYINSIDNTSLLNELN
jgi:hypothetical protein